jgi:L-malate glycosyltransferase
VATIHGLVWSPWRNVFKTVIDLAALATCADAVIATSSDRARRFRRGLRAPAIFVANGVDVGAAAPRRARHASPTVAYIGRLSREKRVDLFLDVCALLLSVIPNVRCRVIGSGTEEQLLRRRAHSLDIADRVDFEGLVADIPAALADIDVLLLLSDTEGTPRVIIEAMAAGVPVVATHVGGVPDLVRDHREALLVPRGDARAAAMAARRLLTESEIAACLASGARQRYCAEFTVAQMSERVLEVYRTAVLRAGTRWEHRVSAPWSPRARFPRRSACPSRPRWW